MRKTTFILIFLGFCCFFIGCNTLGKESTHKDSEVTIGSIVQIDSPVSIQVEGVGLVGGLNGKGSSECPPEIRQYLKEYILSEIPRSEGFNADSFIDSLNTAVVVIEGILPIEDSSKSYFDLKVTAYRGTQTISLENGSLYKSELKLLGRFGIKTDILADAEGPVFIDQISQSAVDKRTGYILGGGKIKARYVIGLILNKADFELTNVIRNRINMRFGRNSAIAVRAGLIAVTQPDKYKEQRGKFIKLLKAIYVYDMPENDQERIDTHIKQIYQFPENDEGELALEAMGNQCLGQLSMLLNSPDEIVRLRAARCMLNLRSDAGMKVLNDIAMNRVSPYRIEALQAVTEAGRSQDASSLALKLLKDDNFNIRLAAFEQLSKLRDIAVSVKQVGAGFSLEKIEQTDKKDIYVARSGQPKVVLFGSPISCNKGFVIQSANGEVKIDAPSDKDYVMVIRKYPNRPDLIGQIKCTYELGNIIQALCEKPPERNQEYTGGLGVTYSDLAALLKQMCDKGAVNAEFHSGLLPKIDLNVKK
jgi:hypothetical protein